MKLPDKAGTDVDSLFEFGLKMANYIRKLDDTQRIYLLGFTEGLAAFAGASEKRDESA